MNECAEEYPPVVDRIAAIASTAPNAPPVVLDRLADPSKTAA